MWPSVKDFLAGISIGFDRWQEGLAGLVLSTREDGVWAATVGGVILSIARQTGKTFVIRWIVFALCCMTPGLKVIWTAHHSQTSDKTMDEYKSMAKSKAGKRFIAKIVDGHDEQTVTFTNGSTIEFGSRARGFGRGFDDVAIIIFDEAQILEDRTMQRLVPTANANQNALVIFMGTPPLPTDPGEVFTHRRERALKARAEDVNSIYIEISCDPVPVDKDPVKHMWDRRQWGKGNPAFLTGRTNEDSMLRMLELLTAEGPEGMLREGLGLWDSIVKDDPIPLGDWNAQCLNVDTRIVTGFTVCLAATRDRKFVYVARAGEREDGMTQVELVARLRASRTSVVKDWLVDHKDRIDEIVGQARGDGRTSELMTELKTDLRHSISVVPWEGAELTACYGRGMDAMFNGVVRTVRRDELDFCVSRVVWKDLAGGRLIDDVKSGTDMAPLKAWFGAYGMRTRTREKQKQQIRFAPQLI